MDDRERTRRTEFFAARLMKCLARHTVYSERAEETGNPALSYIVALEVELLEGAQTDWRAILQHWSLRVLSERVRLEALLRLARGKAEREVRAVYDDKITSEALGTFLGSLKPECFVPRWGTS